MEGGTAGPGGEAVTVLGAAAAIWLAQDRSPESLELLSAFFEALGSNLALIAAQRAVQEAQRSLCRGPDVKSLSNTLRPGPGPDTIIYTFERKRG